MPIKLIPTHVQEQYGIAEKDKDEYVFIEIRKEIYGLPQAGILANKLLKKRLTKHGYYEVEHTPGLWQHKWSPIVFTLVVDDFGMQYVGAEHAMYLIHTLHQST